MTDSRVKKPRWEKLHTGCLQGFKFATAFTYGTSPCSTSHQVIELHLQWEGLTLAFSTFECSLTGLLVVGMSADVGRMQVGTVTGSGVGEPMAVPERIGCRCNGVGRGGSRSTG